jgi:hypothetical protein
MGQFSREEIEMFCLASLINCYIDTDPENNFVDWCAPRPAPLLLLPYTYRDVASLEESWGCQLVGRSVSRAAALLREGHMRPILMEFRSKWVLCLHVLFLYNVILFRVGVHVANSAALELSASHVCG